MKTQSPIPPYSFARTNFFRDVTAMEQACNDATEATTATVEDIRAKAEQLLASATALLNGFNDPHSGITPT